MGARGRILLLALAALLGGCDQIDGYLARRQILAGLSARVIPADGPARLDALRDWFTAARPLWQNWPDSRPARALAAGGNVAGISVAGPAAELMRADAGQLAGLVKREFGGAGSYVGLTTELLRRAGRLPAALDLGEKLATPLGGPMGLFNGGACGPSAKNFCIAWGDLPAPVCALLAGAATADPAPVAVGVNDRDFPAAGDAAAASCVAGAANLVLYRY